VAKNILAKIISYIFGPFIWLPVLFIIMTAKSGLTPTQEKIILPAALFLQVILPILYLVIAPKFGIIDSWEIKDRKQRTPFMIYIFILEVIYLIIVHKFGNVFLYQLNLIGFALLVLIAFINLFWKISQHMALCTISVIVLNFLYGWKLPILYLILPSVFWSRHKLKRHTTSQLLGGFALTAILTLSGLLYFGYL